MNERNTKIYNLSEDVVEINANSCYFRLMGQLLLIAGSS